jgi:hypothetical protein
METSRSPAGLLRISAPADAPLAGSCSPGTHVSHDGEDDPVLRVRPAPPAVGSMAHRRHPMAPMCHRHPAAGTEP